MGMVLGGTRGVCGGGLGRIDVRAVACLCALFSERISAGFYGCIVLQRHICIRNDVVTCLATMLGR